ncbi:MAG: PAS domain S-box protein, partial [Balneolaceae bacterium]
MNSTEKRLNRVEEMANVASWAQDLDTSEFVCSPQLYNMLGLEPGNYMTPEGFFEFLHPEDRDRVQQGFDRVATEGGMHEMDVQLLRPTNGSIRNIHLKAERVPNEKSGREKLIGIFHDITEWQNLKLKEKLAGTFLRRLEDGFLLFDQRGNIVFSNRAYRAMTGYGHAELLKKTIYDLLPDDERETFISKCHHLKESPGDIFIVRHKRNDETIIQFIASLVLVKQHGQIFLGGFLRDLAREQKVLETMNIRNQHFQSLFEHNPHPVYYMDLEGNFEGVNPSMIELSGYSREELLGMDFTPFIPEKEMAKTMENFIKARQGEATEYEIQVVTKDNRHLDVRVTNFPMKEDGEITGVFGIAQDITEAKMLERKRKESEERWQRLVEGNPQPVQVVQDDKIVFINQVGAELYGARFPDEVIGRDILDFSHPETLEKLKERKKKLEEGKYIESDEHRIKRLDGQERIIEAYSVPIWYNGKKAIQTVIYDVTDRRKQKEIMQKSLEEKEVLLQEIHHRVKNNLAVISGLIELQALNTDDPAIQIMLEESQLRVQSMA